MTRFRTRVLLAAAASALATTLVAAPAFAHDALVDSDPAADARLTAAPTEIVLTYSNNVLDESASVAVVDAEGTDWVAGDAVVAGTDVTVPLDQAMPEGAYEVRWRVASSDGHPIDGLIPFTVGDAAPLPTPTTTEHDEDHAHDETATPEAAAPASGDGTLNAVLIGAGAAVAAVAVILIVRMTRRRRDGGTTPRA